MPESEEPEIVELPINGILDLSSKRGQAKSPGRMVCFTK